MFRFVQTLTAWWPVTVYQPDPEKPGNFAAQEFEAEFEILDDDAVKAHREARLAILDAAAADTGEAGLAATQAALEKLDRDQFLRTVKNWRGVVGDDDQPILFSEQMLLTALKRAYVREAILHAYAEAIDSGKARRKN